MAEEPVDVQEEPDEVLPADETVEALPTEEVTVWAPEPTGADEILSTSVEEWIADVEFESTADVPIPDRLVDQVIGQEAGSVVIKKAAEQRRHMLMIGDPGTGKSMLARSMTDLYQKMRLKTCWSTRTKTMKTYRVSAPCLQDGLSESSKCKKKRFVSNEKNPSECSSSPSQQSDSCCSLQPFNQVTCSRSCSVVFCWCLVTCSSEADWGPQTTAVSRRCS